MSIDRFFAFIKDLRLPLTAIAALTVVAGCSSTMSNVETWEGSADASQAAVLEAPGEIQVQQVNGLNLGNFLMDDLALDYSLLPGDNQVVFTYKTIWAKSGVVRNGESKVHVVETSPQVVTIDAQPGETYRFSFDAPESRREAEAFASNFSADIVDASGDAVASASDWDGRSVARSTTARAPVASGGGDAPAMDSVAEGDTLEALKALWGDASEEERRSFLRWAFE